MKVKKEMKKQIIAGMDLNKTELIKLTQEQIAGSYNGFRFIEDHEFQYAGKMFDIVKRENRNDTVYFYCINDKKEEALIASFVDEGSGNGKSNPINKKVLKKLKNFHFDYCNLNKQTAIPDIALFYYSLSATNASSVFHKPDTPPPRNIA